MLAGILEGGNTLWDKLPQLLLVEKWMLGLPPCLESNEKEGILAGWSCNGLEVNQSVSCLTSETHKIQCPPVNMKRVFIS